MSSSFMFTLLNRTNEKYINEIPATASTIARIIMMNNIIQFGRAGVVVGAGGGGGSGRVAGGGGGSGRVVACPVVTSVPILVLLIVF